MDTPANVLTATSTTWTLGPCAAMIDPGAQVYQGMYGWSSDQNVTGDVTAADATYDRKDIVYIQVNDFDMDGAGYKSAPVLYLAGTPSATPTAPDLPVRSLLVGTITVPKAGGGSPTVQLNTARYVAAGGALPIYSQNEQDTIPDKFDGLTIKRMDLPGRPDFTWDGANWNGQAWTSYTPSFAGWANTGSGAVATGSYMMIGPNLCAVRMKLKAGTGASMGTGNLAVSLPFTSAADQSTIGEAQWFDPGIYGALRKVTLSNPPSNNHAAIVSGPGGAGQAVSPGTDWFPYGPTTEVHCTITYRTA
ncbi:MAG TPA: hypothetical protein VGE95_03425 [Arthrobacter sp.]